MDIETLRLFIDVADRLSFAAVARDRQTDPSLVSRTIAGLEAEIGTRLLQRTTRTMTLTDGGERYLERIRPHVEALDAATGALADAQCEPMGLLRVTASAAFGEAMIMPLLPGFRSAFPKLQLELTLSDAKQDLIADRIDIAIRLAPSFRGDMVGMKLFETRYHVVASPEYIAREGIPASPQALNTRNCLLFALPELRSRWIFREGGLHANVPVFGNFVTSNASALRLAALTGLGPALLADWLIDGDLTKGTLIDLFPDHAVTPTSFDTAAWLLYPSRVHMPAKTRAAIDFFCRELRARRAGR